MNFSVAILYAREGHRPVSVARITDRELLVTVAERAVLEAEVAARELTKGDPILGALQYEEVTKLRRIFSRMLAEHSEAGMTAIVM